MIRLAVATLVAGLLSAPATAQVGGLFRCTIQDAVAPDNGALVHDQTRKNLSKIYSPLLIDSSTGAVRMGKDAQQYTWQVTARGGAQNDIVLVNGTSERIAIRIWEAPVQFVFVSNNVSVYAGTCESIK